MAGEREASGVGPSITCGITVKSEEALRAARGVCATGPYPTVGVGPIGLDELSELPDSQIAIPRMLKRAAPTVRKIGSRLKLTLSGLGAFGCLKLCYPILLLLVWKVRSGRPLRQSRLCACVHKPDYNNSLRPLCRHSG